MKSFSILLKASCIVKSKQQISGYRVWYGRNLKWEVSQFEGEGRGKLLDVTQNASIRTILVYYDRPLNNFCWSRKHVFLSFEDFSFISFEREWNGKILRSRRPISDSSWWAKSPSNEIHNCFMLRGGFVVRRLHHHAGGLPSVLQGNSRIENLHGQQDSLTWERLEARQRSITCQIEQQENMVLMYFTLINRQMLILFFHACQSMHSRLTLTWVCALPQSEMLNIRETKAWGHWHKWLTHGNHWLHGQVPLGLLIRHSGHVH